MATERVIYMHQLTITWQMDGVDKTHTLNSKQKVVMGRRLECDIVLSDPSVSREHAAIYASDNTFYLRNMSQINPVMVSSNGEKKELAPDETMPLSIGTEFHIGPVEMKVTALEKLATEALEEIDQPEIPENDQNDESLAE
jgi:predicted component of type VI protein secretion system